MVVTYGNRAITSGSQQLRHWTSLRFPETYNQSNGYAMNIIY